MERSEISKQILHLRWNKKFDEALSVFKEHYRKELSDEHIIADEKLCSSIIDSLKAIGKTKQALDFLILNLKIADNDNINNKLLVNIAWLFLNAYKLQSLDKNRFQYYFRLISKIADELKNKPKDIICSKFLFETIEYWYVEDKVIAERMLLLLKSMDIENLNSESFKFKTIIKVYEKEIELASDKEKYFAWMSKLLFVTEQYEQCIELSEKALQEVSNFHYGNNIWLARRIALSMKQQGNLQQAISKLQQILKKKNDWFLHREIAEMYAKQRDTEKAWEFAISAFLLGGYSTYKIKLIDLMYNLSIEQNKFLTNDFNELQYLIRIENKWNISYKPIDYKNLKTTSTAIYEKLIKELDNNTGKTEIQFNTKGKITKILHEGINGDGFITDEKRRSIYFRFVVSKINHEDLVQGLDVYCIVKKAIKNGKKVWNATKVYKNVKK